MTDHRSRRWFQLSLKSLFLLVLVVAVFFAGYSLATKQAERERRQAELEAQRQAEAARRQGGVADLIVTGPGGVGYVVGNFDSDGMVDLYVANKPSPPQVFRNLGNGKFQDVSGVAGH